MCGLFGVWHRDGSGVDLRRLELATKVLRHRGPDDEGYLLVNTASGAAVACGGADTVDGLGLPALATQVGNSFDLAFGFRRLAIQDLSDAGHQPMCSDDVRLWIVFNGEIYNFIELREQLRGAGHHFHTGTDTEVILTAYRHWGEDCVNQFNGMWAFAIWDAQRRRLFLARDRMGVKPLYTTQTPSVHLAFSSEIKSLLASGIVPFRPRKDVIAKYVALSEFPSQQDGDSFFEGVDVFPPGHCCVVDRSTCTRSRFWSIPDPDLRQPLFEEEAIDTYRSIFRDAVRLRLRGDVPVGTCLSGGLDSSSVVAVLADLCRGSGAEAVDQRGEIPKTFSAVYESQGRWNERHHIDKVLAEYELEPHFIYPTSHDLWNEGSAMAWHLEEPCWSSSMFAQWSVLKEVRRQGIVIIINGQGADELLAGYQPGVFRVLLREAMCAGRPAEAWQLAGQIGHLHGMNAWRLFTQSLTEQLQMRVKAVGPGFLFGRSYRQASRESGLSRELQTQLLSTRPNFDTASPLPSTMHHFLRESFLESPLQPILRYEDRLSMAHSLESRLPFLDYRLVEFVFRNASRMRIRDGWTKWIHRKAMDGLLPADINWRKDKVGFETPLRDWLQEGRANIRDLLSTAVVRTYLDQQAVDNQLSQPLRTSAQAKRLWRWTSLALWLNAYSSRSSLPVPSLAAANN